MPWLHREREAFAKSFRIPALKPAARFQIPPRRWPWATLLIVTLALAVSGFPSLAPALIYDRTAVLHGEFWRLWTGHWVHFGTDHLFWNLAVLVPAGVWAEWLAPESFRLLSLLAPGFIGAALLAFDPSLVRYGGLSGLAAAVLAFLAFTAPAVSPGDRWFWRGVLALLIIKIVAEFLADRSLFAHLEENGVRPVPLAHLAGGAIAAVVHFAGRRRQI
jgi:rhomboid family GlyGly-CTERM serine protease